MTIAADVSTGKLPASRPSLAGDVTWRALERGLWVARRDGRHLGTVEHGRRFRASDAASEPIGVFRTFREAQAAVADPASVAPAAAHPHSLWSPAAVGPVLAAAALCAAAFASTARWAWTSFLL
jgi:hypothetical protein